MFSGHFVMVHDTVYDQLKGLRTEFADWHAKVTLYKVLYYAAFKK